jgi:hypothetical protein
MTLSEIKKACIAVMQTKYATNQYKYYSNTVVEKYVRPCFFTELNIDQSEPASSGSDHFLATFSIEILQDILNEAQALEIATTLRKAFGRYVLVPQTDQPDRAVDVRGYDFDYSGTEDNIPVISVMLEWYDNAMKTETADLMEDVEVSLKVEMEE